MAALLPSTTGDFATVAHWDRFFETRGGAPFAWYVDPAHAAALVAAVLRAASDALARRALFGYEPLMSARAGSTEVVRSTKLAAARRRRPPAGVVA